MGRSEQELERIVKGFANHRRIEMMRLLGKEPDCTLQDISDSLKTNIKTASEHLGRLSRAGLITKRYLGRSVQHRLTPRGQQILTFLRKLE